MWRALAAASPVAVAPECLLVLQLHTCPLHPPACRCCVCVAACSLQPSQLWGVLWGLCRMAHLPPEPWMASWLAAARQQLDGFNAEGLAHSVWALAALGHVPDRLWLRAFSGMVAYKIRLVGRQAVLASYQLAWPPSGAAPQLRVDRLMCAFATGAGALIGAGSYFA